MMDVILTTLLLGPILRRVDEKNICIWTATKKGLVNIRPTLKYEKWAPSKEIKEIEIDTRIESMQMGKNLFVNMLYISPKKDADFPVEVPITYDLLFEFSGFEPENDSLSLDQLLKENDVFGKGIEEISYASFKYPIIYIQNRNSDSTNFSAYYGSCNRANYNYKKELEAENAFIAADKKNNEDWKNWFKNPRTIMNRNLFLVGDQIYADDLGKDMFEYIRQFSRYLMNPIEEDVPVYKNSWEMTTKDLAWFLIEYIKNNRFNIEQLNLPYFIDYKFSNTLSGRQYNAKKFLEQYFPVSLYTNLNTSVVANDKDLSWLLRDNEKYSCYSFVGGRAGVARVYNKKPLDELDIVELLPPIYERPPYKVNGKIDPTLQTKERVRDISYIDRIWYIRTNASLTADKPGCDGHIISFGEYAAMYLITWGHFFWLDTYPFLGAQQATYGGRDSWKNTRRLFANMPVYMIIDDHDITDDFNLDKIWKDRVYASITGRRIIANGLAAYWAFQGWGNQPDMFSTKFKTTVREYFDTLIKDDKKNLEIKSFAYEQTLLNFANWSFFAPTNPVTLFLDSRTCRQPFDAGTTTKENKVHFDRNKKYNPSSFLLGNNEYKPFKVDKSIRDDILKSLISQLKTKVNNNVFILVTTAPFVSYPVFERIAIGAVDNSLPFPQRPGRYLNDMEWWAANPSAKSFFIQCLLDAFKENFRCIFLSGDVHYSFSTQSELVVNSKRNNTFLYQFVSSGINNVFTFLFEALRDKAALIDYSNHVKRSPFFIEDYPLLSSVLYGFIEFDYSPATIIDQNFFIVEEYPNVGLLNIINTTKMATSTSFSINNQFLIHKKGKVMNASSDVSDAKFPGKIKQALSMLSYKSIFFQMQKDAIELLERFYFPYLF